MNVNLNKATNDIFSGPLNRKQRAAIIFLLEAAEGIGVAGEEYGNVGLWPQSMKENFKMIADLKRDLAQLS